MAATRAANSIMWLAVAYVAHDCVCTVWYDERGEAQAGEAQAGEAQAGRGANSSSGAAGAGSRGGSSGASAGSSAAALFVDKASLRFFKYTRGELVIMRWALASAPASPICIPPAVPAGLQSCACSCPAPVGVGHPRSQPRGWCGD